MASIFNWIFSKDNSGDAYGPLKKDDDFSKNAEEEVEAWISSLPILVEPQNADQIGKTIVAGLGKLIISDESYVKIVDALRRCIESNESLYFPLIKNIVKLNNKRSKRDEKITMIGLDAIRFKHGIL